MNWDKYGGTTSPCATIKFYYAPMFNAPWRNWKSLAFLEQIPPPQNCFATFRCHCWSEVDEDVLKGKWKLIKCQEIKSVESTKLLSSVSGVGVEHRRNRKRNFANLTFLSTWQRHFTMAFGSVSVSGRIVSSTDENNRTQWDPREGL